MLGSPAYMPPEQMRGDELTTAIDAWALGLTLWEMMVERKPWDNKFRDFQSLSVAVLGGERVPIPAEHDPYPSTYIELIVQSGSDSVGGCPFPCP